MNAGKKRKICFRQMRGYQNAEWIFDACDIILYHKQPEHSYDSIKTTEQKYEGVAAMNLFLSRARRCDVLL